MIRKSLTISAASVLIIFLTGCSQTRFVQLPQVIDSSRYHKVVDFKGRYLLGAAYYPEAWPPSQWDRDFQKMHDLGFNVVRMGEFAWSKFEPTPGNFQFEWMDKAIELAGKHGISTILCTPTATIPPWLYQRDRRVLSGNSKGPYDFGTKKGENPNDKAFVDLSNSIVTALAEHYGKNENVIGWQLDNEPGFPFTLNDPITTESFRQWLKNKYVSIDSLNKAWRTSYWSQGYTDWKQLSLPASNTADGDPHPCLRLDYRRFFSDVFLGFLQRQANILRLHSSGQFIFTNWPNTSWSVDIFKASSFLDFNGWDNYSQEQGINDYRNQFYAGMNHDLARCSNRFQQFIVPEQDAEPTAAGRQDGAGKRLQLFIDFAHGAYGTMFWEWRPHLSGSSQGYVSVLQIDGTYGPAADQYKRASAELLRLAPQLENTRTASDIALLYSYDDEWNQGFWGSGTYDVEAQKYYSGLKSLKRNVDVISERQDFSKYRLIAAPGLQLVSDALGQQLTDYVENGGILILNRDAGTKDTLNAYRGIKVPGVFASMAGVDIPWISDKVEHTDDGSYAVSFDGVHKFAPHSFLKLIHLKGASVLATIEGGNLQGKAAVTINHAGKGYVVYVGTDSGNIEFYEALIAALKQKFQFKPIIDAPDEVEVVSRSSAGTEYIFLLNLADHDKTVRLNAPALELISGKEVNGDLVLKGLDVAILKRNKL